MQSKVTAESQAEHEATKICKNTSTRARGKISTRGGNGDYYDETNLKDKFSM